MSGSESHDMGSWGDVPLDREHGEGNKTPVNSSSSSTEASTQQSPKATSVGLPYKIAQHKKGWIIWLFCFNLDGCILPILLFYSLWFGTALSHWSDFAVITSFSFWTSYHKWFSRGWRIFVKKDPKFRPINGGRWWFDCSYYVLSIALLAMILELVIATATEDVKVQAIAMVPVSALYVIGLYMLLQNMMHVLRFKTPVTLSSIKRGSVTPPPLFTVMEDVFAVDGCHMGWVAREEMLELYQRSPEYRKVAAKWSWIWGGGAMTLAVILSIIVGTTPETVSFGICYAVSYPFITVMAILTARTMEGMDARGVFRLGACGV
ncbi:hypothetical protein BX600DRAFT_158333 [Xylariales sp. PMI_506]|nr:hypothetical protein BX600DRAFT_158333 [Xylariales sp. PMI_506]